MRGRGLIVAAWQIPFYFATDWRMVVATWSGLAADRIHSDSHTQASLIQTLTTTRYAGMVVGHPAAVSSVAETLSLTMSATALMVIDAVAAALLTVPSEAL